MADFVERHGLDGFPHLTDEAGDVWQLFGIADQPAWAFIDDSGSYEVVFGQLGDAELSQRLDDLLAG